MFRKICIVIFLLVALTAQANVKAPLVPEELRGKVVTVVVPFPPGGETDMSQRWMATQVKKLTGLDVVVVNKVGANAALGAMEVSKSKPDGTTILGGDNSAFIIHPVSKFAPAPDPATLQPVTAFSLTPLVLYTSVNSGLNSIQDVLDKAQKNHLFTAAVGTIHTQMATAQFYNSVGVKVYQVPFKGPVDMGLAVSQGQADAYFTSVSSGLSFVQSGKTKPVGVAWKHALSVYPDAPPITIKGKPFAAYNFQMISVPTGTPAHILEFLNLTWRAAAATEESQQRYKELSQVYLNLTIPQTEQMLQSEYDNALKNIKFIDIKQ